MADQPLHAVSREHLDALTGPHGIWQHATGIVPNEAFGSCTDDVARALIVDLLHRRELGWDAVRESAWRSLRFLGEACDRSLGRFRNFRAADGSWLDRVGSQDSHGRALLALGAVIADAPETEAVSHARALFVATLPAMRRLTALRASASALLGCDAALVGGLRGGTEPVYEVMASRLRSAFRADALDPRWPWPEPCLTYENALLPHALIVAGVRLDDADLRRTGLRVLDWLVRVQTAPDGTFSPIGNRGWWPRGGSRARFDQQPIEAMATILAADAALRATGRDRYARVIEAAYGWFLGDNALGLPIADPAHGGCRDGLTPRGVNLNQGAESTLVWSIALEHVRSVRAAASAAPRRVLGGTALVTVGARL